MLEQKERTGTEAGCHSLKNHLLKKYDLENPIQDRQLWTRYCVISGLFNDLYQIEFNFYSIAMASKYLQKFPVPVGFQQVLHDFAREILRDQPDNIIQYAASYFEMLEQGKKFEYQSKFNVKREAKKTTLEYQSNLGKEVTQKAGRAVETINKNMEKQLIRQSNVQEPVSTGNSQQAEKKQGHDETTAVVVEEKKEHQEKQEPKGRISINLPPDQTKDSEEESKPTRKQIGGAYQASTNTIVVGEGQKYIERVNEQAATQVVREQEEETEQGMESKRQVWEVPGVEDQGPTAEGNGVEQSGEENNLTD